MGRPDEPPPEPDEESSPQYALLFRSWVVLVLLVLCIALLQYLLLKLSG